MRRSHEIDMTDGSILRKLFAFTLPLILTNVLQLLFNAVDTVVVGKFVNSQAMAAVGSSAVLIGMLVSLFTGISIGTNVLVSRHYGRHDEEALSRCVHTSMALSVVLGLLITAILVLLMFFFATPFLSAINVDPEILSLTATYLKIYFLGLPASMLYSFGAAILQAIGDTDRPLRYLTLSGLVNVALNLLFVIVLKADVVGVAAATVISQYISAILVVRCLLTADGSYKLNVKKLAFHKDVTGPVLALGLPAGLQGSIICYSNVILQSAINSFGYAAAAGDAAAGSVGRIVLVAMEAFKRSALCFISQNYGAERYDRVLMVLWRCIIATVAIGLSLTALLYLFAPEILSLYVAADDPDRDAVLAVGMTRIVWECLPFVLCGLREVLEGSLRGMGESWIPMTTTILTTTVFHTLWIFLVFPLYPTLEMVYVSLPISWILASTIHAITFAHTYKKRKRKQVATL